MVKWEIDRYLILMSECSAKPYKMYKSVQSFQIGKENILRNLMWWWHEKWPPYILTSFERIFQYKLNSTKFIEIEPPILDIFFIKILELWCHHDVPLIRRTCKNYVFSNFLKSISFNIHYFLVKVLSKHSIKVTFLVFCENE